MSAFRAYLRLSVDLVWFCLSCGHGWIRSGSVNVRKTTANNNNLACGRKEVLRSMGHTMVTTRYSDQQGSKSRQNANATLQATASTNIKTVHQTSLLHIESNLDRLGLLLPTHDQRSQQQTGQITLQPVYFEQQVQVSQSHTLYRKKGKIEINTEVHGGGGLGLVKRAREPASSRPKACCASLKKPHESCPFAAPCGSRRKTNDRGQTSAFPSEASRFKPVVLAHRGSALPWLVDDRASLRLRRILCVPTR